MEESTTHFDPIEPTQIEFAPAGPGWQVFGIVLAIILIIALVSWYRNYQRNAYRRMALSAIDSLTGADSQEVLEIGVILKQTAITAYGREYIAGLSGSKWLEFLNKKVRKPLFSEIEHDALNAAVYNPGVEPETESVKRYRSQTRKWIETHGV